MNAILAPINLAKSFTFNTDPASQNSDCYPTTNITANAGSQGSFVTGYNKLVWKYNGACTMSANASSAIIYTGGSFFAGLSNNCVANAFTIANTNSVVNPRVVFKWGSLISSCSGGNGTPVTINLVNSPTVSVGMNVQIGVGVSASLANGPNSDGSWTIASGSGSAWVLANSSTVVNPTVTGTGGPDVQSELCYSNSSVAISIISSGTISGFGNLVICTLANEPLNDAGKLVDPLYIAQLQALNVRWLRMMDISGVQGNYESDFTTARIKSSFISWPATITNPNYWVGTLHNAGSDAYTCSAPSLTSTGAYKHGETVSGNWDATNSTGYPTININGRGAKQIIPTGVGSFQLLMPNAAASGNQSMAYTFTATWLNGGTPYVFTYLTQTVATVTGAANNGSGKVRLTVNSSAGYVTGLLYTVAGVVGTTEANNLVNGSPGQQAVTVIDSTHIDLNINFVNTYVSGGTVTPRFGDDTVLTGSPLAANNLIANISQQLNDDPVINGHITFRGTSVYPLTPQMGALTISYSGAVTSTPVAVPIGTFTNAGKATLVYNYILDAFVYVGSAPASSVPIEYMIELCNAVGANLYYNFSFQATGALVTAFTAYARDNLRADLCFGGEVANEVWNFGAAPWGKGLAYGYALGLGIATHYDNGASYSYTAMRTKQFGALMIAAWTTTRSRSQLYVLSMSAEWDQGNYDTYCLGGAFLDATTLTSGVAVYGTYGGIDGVAGSSNPGISYNAYPDRLGDYTDGFGLAPYWGSDFLSGDTGGAGFTTTTLGGTVAQNAPLLAAAIKWSVGNFTGGSGAYDDLYNQFYAPLSLGGPTGGLNLLRTYRNQVFPQCETILRKYDPSRIASQGRPIAVIHYEAGPQFGLGNINNGTNSPTIDIPAVGNRIANNIAGASAWDISAYVASTTVAISSGTYSTSTGVITLTMASSVSATAVANAGAILGLTGTGANLASLNGGWKSISPTTGTTVTLQGPAGKGTITITGGTLYLNAVEMATYLCGMVYNFKFSTQFYQLYKNYLADVTKVHSGREACGSQYGYAQGQWGLFPGNWTLGLSTAYSSAQATADFNTGL